MLYTVTIEPATRSAALPVVRSAIEAPDKDTALTHAESAYRRKHPGTSRLHLYVLRVRTGADD